MVLKLALCQYFGGTSKSHSVLASSDWSQEMIECYQNPWLDMLKGRQAYMLVVLRGLAWPEEISCLDGQPPVHHHLRRADNNVYTMGIANLLVLKAVHACSGFSRKPVQPNPRGFTHTVSTANTGIV